MIICDMYIFALHVAVLIRAVFPDARDTGGIA